MQTQPLPTYLYYGFVRVAGPHGEECYKAAFIPVTFHHSTVRRLSRRTLRTPEGAREYGMQVGERLRRGQVVDRVRDA